jgi:hypothetical protein
VKMSVDGRFSIHVAAAMVGAACAWHFGVQPLHQGLAEARGANVTARMEIAAHEARHGGEASSPVESISMFTKREQALLGRSTQSSDAAKIYEALGALASARSVRIERIEPARGPVRDTRAKAGETAARATCDAVGYSIEAVGEFGNLVSFADAVQTELGLTKVLSIRIGPGPAGGKPVLSASIETAHFKLAVDKPDAKKGGAK